MSKLQEEKEGGFYVVEPVDISSESEPNEDVDIEDTDDIKVDDEEINDLDKLIANTRKEEIAKPVPIKKTDAKKVNRLEVVDDFIRNFLIKHKMNKSLEIF